MTEPADSIPPSPSASAAEVSPAVVPPPPVKPKPNGLQTCWTWLVRLVLLGGGISLGWLVGVLIAQVAPNRNPEPPLQERVMRQTSATVRKVRQLPHWWQGDPSSAINPKGEEASPPAGSPTEEASPLPPTPSPAANGSPLEAELTALQAEFEALENRLSNLETQLGQPSTGSVENRLQQLEQRSPVTPESPAPTPNPPSTTSGEPTTSGQAANPATPPGTEAPTPAGDGLGSRAAAPYQAPEFPLVSDRIVLPSALLFPPESSILTAAGEQLLNSIVADLRRYGPVTLLVGSHTDGDINAAEGRQLTFQQSLAIQQYLEPQLADTGVRWVALGYGKTRPAVVGDDPGIEQRNQRVEIGIVRP